MLAKRFDRAQLTPGRCQLPIHEELVLVLGCPLDREPQRTRWKPPIEDLQAPNRDLDLEFAICGVEMRRVMIIEVHLDDDAKEARYLGHRPKIGTRTHPRLKCHSSANHLASGCEAVPAMLVQNRGRCGRRNGSGRRPYDGSMNDGRPHVDRPPGACEHNGFVRFESMDDTAEVREWSEHWDAKRAAQSVLLSDDVHINGDPSGS